MKDQIRTILKDNAHLSVDIATLHDDQNLYSAGMSSHSTANVMLALEDLFKVEFPARLLRRSVFSSINNIRDALEELLEKTELAH